MEEDYYVDFIHLILILIPIILHFPTKKLTNLYLFITNYKKIPAIPILLILENNIFINLFSFNLKSIQFSYICNKQF